MIFPYVSFSKQLIFRFQSIIFLGGNPSIVHLHFSQCLPLRRCRRSAAYDPIRRSCLGPMWSVWLEEALFLRNLFMIPKVPPKKNNWIFCKMKIKFWDTSCCEIWRNDIISRASYKYHMIQFSNFIYKSFQIEKMFVWKFGWLKPVYHTETVARSHVATSLNKGCDQGADGHLRPQQVLSGWP